MTDLDTIMDDISQAGRGRPFTPSPENAAILNRALGYVKSVPYKVTLRWLFYRLFQDGTYGNKTTDYLRLKALCSTARKRFWNGWTPDALADDTREAIECPAGHATTQEWVEAVATYGVKCDLDFWRDQANYVEVWFESETMAGQFKHYTQHITLRPFKGDPSIPYKWTIAKALERAAKTHPDRPIVILYFGDYDPKGLTIPESATKDIRQWCGADFRFIRAGLNAEHPALYSIPENIDKPNCYQWVGLDDQSAGNLIVSTVERWVDLDGLQAVDQRAQQAEDRLLTHLHAVADAWYTEEEELQP